MMSTWMMIIQQQNSDVVYLNKKIGSLNNKCKADLKMIFDSVGVIDVKRSKNVSIQVANLKQIETK